MNTTLPVIIKGKTVDEYTRCTHYHSQVDVIAIKFKCCNEYYPCYECHEEEAGHMREVWTKNEFDKKAVLCGICKNELTIHEYLASGNHCPNCHTDFNPNCSKHYHLYFEI
jgi:uncharacterized CHY-type Zn-finger protein